MMKKKVLLTLSIVFATTFLSCSKDETSTSSIVGKWRTEKFDYYVNGQFQETQITVEDNSNCPDYVEFKTNGNYESIKKDINCIASVDESGTYVFNGTTLTYNSSGSSNIVTVTSLTATDLKIEFTETSSQGAVFKNVGYFKKTN